MTAAVILVATYDITNPDRYEHEYVPALLATLRATDATVLVATGSAETLDGAPAGHTVVIRFENRATFDTWRSSPATQVAGELRDDTTTNRTIVAANEYTHL